MLTAVALPRSALPLHLAEHPRLTARTHARGGEQEVQFHLAAAVPMLPIWHEGQLRIVRWGCRRGESRVLPVGGWTRQTTVESGYWSESGAKLVDVPAALGLDGGVWFAIRQGVRGVLVRDEQGVERVYLICEPASHYYNVMTRSTWMPVLINERI
jgi:hypothetical protein